MAFVIKFAKGVRNHWKKSTFAAIAIVYGCNYAKESYDIKVLMRSYCEEAAKYGHKTISPNENPRVVTVVLNPNANKRKATKEFEKYCAPILNLAGICVEIIQTESEGHAKTLIEKLEPTDAIVVAGGDGTVSEVVTGLLRHYGEQKHNLKPIGILPLGKSNTLANRFFPGGNKVENVKSLANASLAIIEESTKPIDVMRIEVDDEEIQSKPIYAVSAIEWGALRDAYVKQDKYWYFGPLRKYATYIFNGYKSDLAWECAADVLISPPCEGCSNCRVNNFQKRWYHRFLSYRSRAVDYTKIINEKCKEVENREIVTADLTLTTTNANDGPPRLELKLGPSSFDYLNFVTLGIRSLKGEKNVSEIIEARQIELKPKDDKKEMWYSIDKENFEAKPIKITLLPQVIPLFYKKELC